MLNCFVLYVLDNKTEETEKSDLFRQLFKITQAADQLKYLADMAALV